MLDISTEFLSKVSPEENFITKPNLTEKMWKIIQPHVHIGVKQSSSFMRGAKSQRHEKEHSINYKIMAWVPIEAIRAGVMDLASPISLPLQIQKHSNV
jgi:hypothetical protein